MYLRHFGITPQPTQPAKPVNGQQHIRRHTMAYEHKAVIEAQHHQLVAERAKTYADYENYRIVEDDTA